MNVSEVTPKVDQIIVKTLENLLSQAKAGEIDSIAVVGGITEGQVFSVFECGSMPFTILGQLRALERDIIDIHIETRVKVGCDCYPYVT